MSSFQFIRSSSFQLNRLLRASNSALSFHSSSSSSSRLYSSSSSSNSGRESAAVIQSSNKKNNNQDKIDLKPPKGTRDFYPDDYRLQMWLFDTWRGVAERFGFEEYDAPVLETESLYIRKAGEEVTQQLYNFEDKGGRRLSLRPEMTPSLARMVMAKKGGLSFPLKWFSFPQCWRYERMTRGRRREHYQWNMDIWGVEGVEAEAELLSAIVTSFQQLGINSKDVGIKINSRKLLQALMKLYNVPDEKFAATCVLIDKLEKVPLEAVKDDLKTLGLDMKSVGKMLEALQMNKVDDFKDLLGEDCEGVRDLQKLFNLAEAYDFVDWLQFDASVVRGLSYYTGVVFEAFDRKGELRAICGGGRYDRLLESFGGEAVPAVGFGFGDAVIIELLASRDLLPDTSKGEIDAIVYPMEDSLRTMAVTAAKEMRGAGINVDVILEQKKPKWVFSRAEKMGANAVVMFAPDEAANGEVVVKNLDKREQEIIKVEELVGTVANIVALDVFGEEMLPDELQLTEPAKEGK